MNEDEIVLIIYSLQKKKKKNYRKIILPL